MVEMVTGGGGSLGDRRDGAFRRPWRLQEVSSLVSCVQILGATREQKSERGPHLG